MAKHLIRITTFLLTITFLILLSSAVLATGYYCEPLKKPGYYYCDNGNIMYHEYIVMNQKTLTIWEQSNNQALRTNAQNWQEQITKLTFFVK